MAATPFTELEIIRTAEHLMVLGAREEALFLVDGATGVLVPVTRIRAEVSMSIHGARVPMTHATIGGLPTAWGRWSLGGQSRLMIVSEPTGRDPRISMLDGQRPSERA